MEKETKMSLEGFVEEVENILYGMNININQKEYNRVFSELKPKLTKLIGDYTHHTQV